MLPYQILSSTINVKICNSHTKKNKFKMYAPKWNVKFKLSKRSYSISDIQVCFE